MVRMWAEIGMLPSLRSEGSARVRTCWNEVNAES